MSNKNLKIYFVPHTHWDKEWYFTKEASSVFLVDNILKLKEIANNPDSFSHHIYDSQLSIIDDYLEFYPEDFEIIKKLIKEKKLIVGPWYSQPDMFSTSGESLIRNLSYGKHFASELGFSAKQAYTPDSFGFNSNLPQILKQNDCDAIIQWRGVDDSHIGQDVFNKWVGIDGSQVYLYNLFKYGYGLTYWAFNSVYKKWNKENIDDLAKEYLQKFKDGSRDDLINLKKMNKGNIICFPFGSDQSPVVEWLPLFVKKLNEIDNENEWILSDYDGFIEDIIQQYGEKANVIEGELKYGKYSRTHRTIGSSRYDIKSLNKIAENLLYNISEPLGVLYKNFTGKYPTKIYQKALRFLLESHAHDSLGGSCTDEANGEVLSRIKKAIYMLESQNTLIKKRIVEFLNLEKNDLLIFNLLPYKRDVETKIKIVSRSKKFKLFDLEKNEIDFKLLDIKYYDRSNFVISTNSQVKNDKSEKGFYINEVIVKFNNIDGISYKVFKVWEDEKPFKEMVRKLNKENKIENEKYLIKYENNKLNIKNKILNETFNMWLVADQDAGDTYDYSPSSDGLLYEEPKSFSTFTEVDKNISKLIIKSKYKLPASLDKKNLVTQDLIWTIILTNNNLNFDIEMENKINDIRWRVYLETNQKNEFTFADQSLSLIKRPVYETNRMKIWEEEKWKDMPVAIENFYKFIYINRDDNLKIGIKSDTLNEYECMGEQFDKLAITLFRGVSLIGRRNLLYRPGRASGINDYPHMTPESNLIKFLKFNFGLILTKEISPNKIYEESSYADFYQNQNISDYLWIGQTFWRAKVDCINYQPKPLNIFKKIDKNLIISSFKIAYDEKNIICRIINLSNSEIDLTNNIGDYQIFETNALERNNKEFIKILKPNEIKTLKIIL